MIEEGNEWYFVWKRSLERLILGKLQVQVDGERFSRERLSIANLPAQCVDIRSPERQRAQSPRVAHCCSKSRADSSTHRRLDYRDVDPKTFAQRTASLADPSVGWSSITQLSMPRVCNG